MCFPFYKPQTFLDKIGLIVLSLFQLENVILSKTIDCSFLSIMREIKSFVNGGVFHVESREPVLIPLVLSYVSAGFSSQANDCIETSIDLNKELICHPFANELLLVR